MRIRVRVCTECGSRCKPREGRYCYLAPVPGHKYWDFVCNECRRLIAAERRRGL